MIDIHKIEKMMQLMMQNGFDVLHAEGPTEKISLARNGANLILQNSSPAQQNTSQKQKNLEENTIINPVSHPTPDIPKETLPKGETITSPFVGTFYRSSSPAAKSFVEIGSRVKKGQALCIVEAMKLMNEIEAEIDGEVAAILIENGKPVEFGSPLFVLSPN